MKMKKENKKYLMIFDRHGILHSTNYGGDDMINKYLSQGFGVAIFDDVKLAIEQLTIYQKLIKE
jgi:hypothetical protein